MAISVPASAQGAFTGNMQTGQKIELPFPAPAFYIVNGDAKLAALKNYAYFGGFAASSGNVKAASENWENCPFPIPGFVEEDLNLEDTVVPSHVARSLIVAPIGMRPFSTIRDASGSVKRVAPFTKGARPALQVLVVLGHRNEQKQIQAWAPALLTAKGYQVNHLQKAFTDWKKAITPFMKEIAPGMPADVTNLFWMHIGTFGPERKSEKHGESSITPITTFIPDGLTAQQVENMYVGDGMAEFMASLSIQAEEWMKAYQSLKPAEAVAVDSTSANEPLPPEEDEIPF